MTSLGFGVNIIHIFDWRFDMANEKIQQPKENDQVKEIKQIIFLLYKKKESIPFNQVINIISDFELSYEVKNEFFMYIGKLISKNKVSFTNFLKNLYKTKQFTYLKNMLEAVDKLPISFDDKKDIFSNLNNFVSTKEDNVIKNKEESAKIKRKEEKANTNENQTQNDKQHDTDKPHQNGINKSASDVKSSTQKNKTNTKRQIEKQEAQKQNVEADNGQKIDIGNEIQDQTVEENNMDKLVKKSGNRRMKEEKPKRLTQEEIDKEINDLTHVGTTSANRANRINNLLSNVDYLSYENIEKIIKPYAFTSDDLYLFAGKINGLHISVQRKAKTEGEEAQKTYEIVEKGLKLDKLDKNKVSNFIAEKLLKKTNKADIYTIYSFIQNVSHVDKTTKNKLISKIYELDKDALNSIKESNHGSIDPKVEQELINLSKKEESLNKVD